MSVAGERSFWKRAMLLQLLLAVVALVVLVLRSGGAQVLPARLLLSGEPGSPESQLARDGNLGYFDADLISRVHSAAPAVAVSGGAVAPVVDHGESYRDAEWLLRQDGSRWVLQVMGAEAESSVLRFLQGRDDAERFSYFQTMRDGAPWFVVIYGDFPSRELAAGVAETLDFGLGSRPFPKAMSVIQAENQPPVSAQEPAAVVPVPVTEPAAPGVEEAP